MIEYWTESSRHAADFEAAKMWRERKTSTHLLIRIGT